MCNSLPLYPLAFAFALTIYSLSFPRVASYSADGGDCVEPRLMLEANNGDDDDDDNLLKSVRLTMIYFIWLFNSL